METDELLCPHQQFFGQPVHFHQHNLMNCRVCDWYPFGEYLQCSYIYYSSDPIYLAEIVGYGDRYAHIITTHVNKSFVLQSSVDIHRSPIQIKVHLVYLSSLCILLILLLWK